jgi:hypothetical protein
MDRISELEKQLEQEREKVKGLHEITKVICTHCCEPMEIPSKAVLQTQLTQLQALVRALLTVLDEIDRYQQQPERSDIDTECACCMGELFSAEDRTKMVEARAILDATTPAATIGEQCSYCQKPLTTNHSFSYGFPGVPRVYKCDRTECIKPKGGDGE